MAVIIVTSDILGSVNITVNGRTVTLDLNGETKELLFAFPDYVLKAGSEATLNVSGLTAKGEKVTATYTIQNTSDDLSANLSSVATNQNKEYDGQPLD